MAEEVDRTKACSLGTNQRASVGHTLTGQHARILESQLAIHTVEVANLACANTDIAGRNVSLGADMAPQLGHKGLAEAHNLTVGLALRVEVRATLRTAHRQRGESILEDLLKTEELENRGIHRRMEAQTALVGANRIIKLDTIAGIDLNIALIINPNNLESKLTVGLDDTLSDAVCLKFRVLIVSLLNGSQHLSYCLQVLVLARMTALEFCH